MSDLGLNKYSGTAMVCHIPVGKDVTTIHT